jgi:hypothetical protein
MESEGNAVKHGEPYNAPAHRLVLVTNFLTKKNVTTLEHPPFSPDLAAADFYLFLDQ